MKYTTGWYLKPFVLALVVIEIVSVPKKYFVKIYYKNKYLTSLQIGNTKYKNL
jgi:hypothetical protein